MMFSSRTELTSLFFNVIFRADLLTLMDLRSSQNSEIDLKLMFKTLNWVITKYI